MFFKEHGLNIHSRENQAFVSNDVGVTYALAQKELYNTASTTKNECEAVWVVGHHPKLKECTLEN